MSKSKGNVVSPDAFIDDYGSDTFRMYLMFTGPFEEGGDWNDKGIRGVYRFLSRIWSMAGEEAGGNTADSAELERMRHSTVKKVTGDIERFHFNTAISALMEYVNYLSSEKENISMDDWKDSLSTLNKLLGPFAPHFAEELWSVLGGVESLFSAGWPSYEEAKTEAKEITLVIQVNGKVRQKITVPSGCSREALEKYALEDERIKSLCAGRTVNKVVVVPDKLVNIVLG